MNAISLVVSVGTDHHRFDRLIDWVERWVADTEHEVALFVQHGSSRAPSTGVHVEMVGREQMLERYRDADVVVTQVGPGTITDVESAGKIPIVVPRNPDLGEHIDGHQIVFGRFMARSGRVRLAEDEAAFRDLLSAAAADPGAVRAAPRRTEVDETARAVAAVIDDVMQRPAGFIRWSRLMPQSRRRASVGSPVPAATIQEPIALVQPASTPTDFVRAS